MKDRAKYISRTVSAWGRAESINLPSLYDTFSTPYALPIYDFDLHASHARTHLPAALASVPFGIVLVRVRVRIRYVQNVDETSWETRFKSILLLFPFLFPFLFLFLFLFLFPFLFPVPDYVSIFQRASRCSSVRWPTTFIILPWVFSRIYLELLLRIKHCDRDALV